MKQGYLVITGVAVAYVFTWIPEWTTWILLVAMALYDILAGRQMQVLSGRGTPLGMRGVDMALHEADVLLLTVIGVPILSQPTENEGLA